MSLIFSRSALLIEELDSDPIVQFEKWFREAWDENYPMPHAMSLATASAEGLPTVRTVLLKRYDPRGFVFFTNYGSRKAKQISDNPQAVLLFPWVRLGRQITVAGRVEKISKSESVQYFLSRTPGQPTQCLGLSAEQRDLFARNPRDGFCYGQAPLRRRRSPASGLLGRLPGGS